MGEGILWCCLISRPSVNKPDDGELQKVRTFSLLISVEIVHILVGISAVSLPHPSSQIPYNLRPCCCSLIIIPILTLFQTHQIIDIPEKRIKNYLKSGCDEFKRKRKNNKNFVSGILPNLKKSELIRTCHNTGFQINLTWIKMVWMNPNLIRMNFHEFRWILMTPNRNLE